MSKEDKNAVLMAARKLKRTNRKPGDIEQVSSSDSRGIKNDEDDEGIVGGILNAVSKFKNRD